MKKLWCFAIITTLKDSKEYNEKANRLIGPLISTIYNKVISLEIKSLKYDYKLKELENKNVYAIDEQTINVDLNQLNSFNDIFNVFGDIWNMKSQYNNLVDSPYTQIYDYQFDHPSIDNQNFLYLEKRAKVNNTIANIYDWNFDYNINFWINEQEHFVFEIEKLNNIYCQLLSLISLYSDKNYYVEPIGNTQYQVKDSGTPSGWSKKPNFVAYPIVYLNHNSQELLDEEEIDYYMPWNPMYVSTYMPQNSYIFYEKIINLIYQNFFEFSKSNIFQKRINNNFNRVVKVYEYIDEVEKVSLQEYPDLDYKNAPLDIDAKLFDNKDSYSYLEYMLSQWLFNTEEYAENFQNLKLSKEEVENLQIKIQKEENNNQIILDTQMGSNWTIENNILNSFSDDTLAPQSKMYVEQINIKPKYGYINSWKDANDFLVEIGLIIEKHNDSYQVTKKYIDQIFDPNDFVTIDDRKLQKEGEKLLANNGNNILDIVNLDYRNQELITYLDSNPQSYKIEQLRDPFDSSGENKGHLSITFDLSNSDLYFEKKINTSGKF